MAHQYNPATYNRVERLTLRGWEQVVPMKIRELDILRMFDPNQRPSPPLKDISGGTVWLAVGKPFIRTQDDPYYDYEGWAVHTMRLNLVRELYWRIGLVIGRYWSEME